MSRRLTRIVDRLPSPERVEGEGLEERRPRTVADRGRDPIAARTRQRRPSAEASNRDAIRVARRLRGRVGPT